MEEHHLAIRRRRCAPRALEAVVARGQQLALSGPRARDAGGRCVLDVVAGVREAVAAVREEVVPVKFADDNGRLDQGAVLGGAVQDLDRVAYGRDPVVDVHLLEHDGRGVNGRDAVVAVAAVADTVAISV